MDAPGSLQNFLAEPGVCDAILAALDAATVDNSEPLD
jgi:hypothetical protein